MNKGRRELLWQKIDGCPDLLPLHFAKPERYPFLLESTSQAVDHRVDRGRYDILFAFPKEKLTLTSLHDLTIDGRKIDNQDFLYQLDRWFIGEQIDPYPTLSSEIPLEIPFRGGWFLYLGYDLAARIEPILYPPLAKNTQTHADRIEAQFPIAVAWRVPAAIICDKRKQETILITEPDQAHHMEELEMDLLSEKLFFPPPSLALDTQMQEDPSGEFLERIGKITRYIREGDVFQVNLSRGWHGRLQEEIKPGQIYHRLRQYNSAPFSGLAVWDDFAVISSSPERLIHIQAENGHRMVETRPIAGTHPRDSNLITDRQLSNTLMSHPKERAEHIMLIDLERNDLGKVCEYGSVRVDELMALESYTHVHHIVSNVRGKLTDDATPGKVLRAVFPGGTITGCPKVRCMEIIAELEQVPRGPYTGSMGYLNRDGSADLNILIRTICQHGNQLSLRAGAGIVADSIAERELKETRHKAQGPLRALS